jgi:DNA-binding NarL/FixJ family response regulator
MLSISFVEDNLLFARGVARFYKHVRFDLVSSTEEARARLDADWDGWLIDVQLPDGVGFDVAVELRKRDRYIPLLMLTASDDAWVVERCAREGLKWALKEAWKQEVDEFLKLCEAHVPVAARLRATDTAPADAVAYCDEHRLTPKQAQIVQLAVEGLAPQEIRARLGISTSTYDTHVGHVLDKTAQPRLKNVVIAILSRNKALRRSGPPRPPT